jgi:endonuclease-8
VADGPEVHRLARDVARHRGARLRVPRRAPRYGAVAAALDGSTLEWVEVIGKHLVLGVGAHRALHLHLGGRGRVDQAGEADAALTLRLDDEALAVIDPRVCEVVDADEVERLRSDLGPDPLRDDADPERAWQRLRTYRGPVAAALIDQSVVAGTGNAVRADALHEARIHPLTRAAALSRADFARLWTAVRRQMRERQEASGTDEGRVYRRKRCAECGRPVQRVRVEHRTAYFCPRCQPPPGTQSASVRPRSR